MTAEEIINKVALIDLPELVESISESEKEDMRRNLEGLAMRAAEMAAYIDCRQTHGASDEGHKKAIKNLNRVAKLLWVKGFGYNDVSKVSF